jgi:hypothetical protein
VKKDEMGMACSMYREKSDVFRALLGRPEERDQ